MREGADMYTEGSEDELPVLVLGTFIVMYFAAGRGVGVPRRRSYCKGETLREGF